ncbi:5' DNA nuclease [Rhizobium sp. CG5]|uniref:5' DNA nuclease n=1 Tax=Rhizobium sp. CG5 TaxID=2726076 RepID=UPI0020331D6C|nr:5' DNA nuclease [Rhizobium sp. CG5]MCM2473830.1 5' DNA nuclease [Rhizobium sp. CG5]
MVKASDKTKDGGAPEPADFSRVADALKDIPAVPLHPLMAHPAAAFAAATAIGFGFATQMAGAFFGSLQGVMDASNRLARKAEEGSADDDAPLKDLPAESPEPVAAVAVASEPEIAKPVATPKPAAKPSATKAPAAKPSAAKAPAAKAPAAKSPAASPVAKAKAGPAVTPVAKAAAKPVKTEKTADKAPVAKPAPAKAEPAPAKAKVSKAKPDDLKTISGIGPKVEQVLNGMGYSRYADIAGWTEADIAKVEETLGFAGRVERDDWVGQAKAQVKPKAKTLKGSKA